MASGTLNIAHCALLDYTVICHDCRVNKQVLFGTIMLQWHSEVRRQYWSGDGKGPLCCSDILKCVDSIGRVTGKAHYVAVTFWSVLTVLVGWRERHPVYKNPKVLLWESFEGSGLTLSDLCNNRQVKQTESGTILPVTSKSPVIS